MTKSPTIDHDRRSWGTRLTWLALLGATFAGYLALIDSELLFTFWTDQAHYLSFGVSRALGLGRYYGAIWPHPFDDFFNHSGFAFLLAPIIKWRGLDVPLLKAMVIVVFFAGLGAYGDLVRIRDGSSRGWQAAILTATAPFVLTFSQMIMADLPYAGAAFLALWAFERWSRSRRWWWLATALAATLLAQQLRIVSYTLILALGLQLLRRPSDGVWPIWTRRLTLFSLAVIALWWPIYGGMVNGAAFFRLLGTEVQKIDNANRAEQFNLLLMIMARLRNPSAYLNSLGQVFVPLAGRGVGGTVVGLLALPLGGLGFIHRWKKGAAAPEYYLVLSLIMLMAWPYPEHRYFLPLYPLLIGYTLDGAGVLTDRLRPRWSTVLLVAFFVAVLMGNLVMDGRDVVSLDGRARIKALPMDVAPWIMADPGVGSLAVTDRFRMKPINVPRRNLLRLELWCRDHLAPTARVSVPYEGDFYLITGMPCAGYILPGESLGDYIIRTGATHVIISESLPNFSNLILEWHTAQPGRFTEIHRIFGTRTAIYRIQ